MKCKKITGNVLDILDNDDERSKFLKKWIHNQKYQSYTAHEHMREEQLLRRRALNCWDREPPGYSTAHLEDLYYAIGKEMENAIKEIIKQIAESENVSFELAEWWFNKNMKLVLDFSDFRKIEVRSEFKSVDELLYDIDVETEYDRKMEKELIESTLGKVKR